MIFNIFNKRDTTLYERYTSMNTGLDAMLEINKVVVDTGEIYNSRILIDFDFANLTSILSTEVQQSASYSLKLFTAEASEIPVDYTLFIHPVSQSWNMGTGRYTNAPITVDGASWTYRLNASDAATKWLTSSFETGSTGGYASNPGGGTWYTAYQATQSYDYSTTDLNADVSAIVKAWLTGSLPNNGFVIKKSFASETGSDTFNSIKFFSKDTHTIYQPQIQVKWKDANYQTSHSIVSFDDEVAINFTNLSDQYKETDKPRFNISARPKYPTITFATSSNYLDIYQLPSSSFYSILDAKSDEVIIPFDETYTQISADRKGSYFKLFLDGLQPERYYRVAVKAKVSNTEEYVFDKNWIFKLTR